MDKKDIIGQTSISILDFVVESGLSLIPGASIPYNGLKKLVGFVQNYNEYNNEQKIHKFISTAFENNSLDDFDIDIDDFSKIIDSFLKDIEDEKSEIYGKLCRGMVKNKSLQKGEKKELILTIRDLTINDILFLRKLYIHARYNIDNYYGKINHLFQTNDIKINISKNRLLNYSLIDIDKNTITDYANLLIKTVFDESELTPENIGLREWRKIAICIISYQLNNKKHTEIATEIENVCFAERISTSIIRIIGENIKSAKLLFSAGILILDEDVIDNEHITLLNDFSKKRPLFGVNIGKEIKSFCEINFTKIYTISDCKEIKNIFMNVIKNYGI
jgi:hypothetical protein